MVAGENGAGDSPGNGHGKGPVAFVLKGYPRLSETFIAQEIQGLEERGLDIQLVSLRHPTDKTVHPIHREIKAPVCYLPEYLHQEPARVMAGWRKARRLPGYPQAWAKWVRDFKRDPTRNRARRFGQACVLAAELPQNIERLHFHFLHTPASVTRYAAIMRGLPWSGSAHAKDIWTSPDWEIREKLAECDWLVTCTASGASHLKTLASDPEKVILQYHGLDLERFNPVQRREASQVPVILSVGRAVPKKGYDDLLTALARLPSDQAWRFDHIGGGKDLHSLKQQAETLGIADRCTWRGAQSQETVLSEMRAADIFVLASKIAADGDRDGLPNVLMEAQSQGLCTVATDVSAIPELIQHEETGLLVAPGDPDSLSSALKTVLRDPLLRQRLGQAGERRVRSSFDAGRELDTLVKRFG